MKMPALLTALHRGLIPLLLAAALHATRSQAQITPPNLMSYQGYLTDGGGNPLGATNSGPKNYNVVFRVWNVQGGGTIGGPAELYAEQQTVTVDNGYFSVLLGQGGAYQSEPHGALSGVFINSSSKSLFVEFVVLGIGPGPSDVTIAPRLQLLTSPYAFLAANAVNVTGNNVITSGNIANGTITSGNIAAGTITSGKIANGTITGGNIAASTITGANIANNTITSANILDGTITTSDLAASVANGLWQGDGNNVYRPTGSVGIGTISPVATLEVNGSSQVDGNAMFRGNVVVMNSPNVFMNSAVSVRTIGTFGIVNSSNGSPSLTVLDSGNVGIGTSNPTHAALEVESAQNASIANTFYYANGNGGWFSHPGETLSFSIWAGNRIAAAEYETFSDARTKNIIAHSDSSQDLKKLMGIEVTDYTFKDVVAKGNRPQKKVIAQQVEQVYPQAVSQNTDVVPDIYRNATLKDGWAQLPTDLKVGERVKLIGEKEKGIYAVLEVRDGAFRTDFKPATDQVFVYGREVKDFRSVDYDAISMLNVSATQELARRLEKLEARESHFAELAQKTSRVATLEQEVADLKKMVVQLAVAGKGTKLAAQPTPQTQTAASGQTTLTTASLDH